MRQNNVTKWLFLGAFAALLAGSIPHVAYIYHFYEASNSGTLGWIISYSVACSIDILILWLSFIQSNGTLNDVKIVWVFTFLLAVLSWYCNWLYDMLNSTTNGLVWHMSLIDMLTSIATIGDLTPKIVSALPLFILAYTYMHRRITNAQLTHTDYKTYADELEATQAEKERISTIKRSNRNRALTNFVSDIATVSKNVKTSFTAPSVVAPSLLPAPSHTDEDNEEYDVSTDKISTVLPSVATPSLLPAPSHTDEKYNVSEIPNMEHVTAIPTNGHKPVDDFNGFINMLKKS